MQSILGAAYVINLDSRPQRWIDICDRHAQFSALMRMASPHVGIVDDELIRLPATAMPDKPCVGCALSHKRAIEAAAESNKPLVLVLEDDATWSQAIMATPDTLRIAVSALSAFINAARIYADYKSCAIFLGAGTVSQNATGIKWIKRYDQHYLGVVSSHNTVVTATHGMLYLSGSTEDKEPKKVDYEDIITCLTKTADPDSWCTHIDLALSQSFAGMNRLFVVAPFFVHFLDHNVASDVRLGKTTERDYDNLRDTENKLTTKAFQSGIL